jgi:alpha-1,2-mannosyltransferase
LWTLVKAILEQTSSHRIYIYSGGPENIREILEKVKFVFGIDLTDQNIELIKLKRVKWIEAKEYPVATLFFQFLGSMVLMHEVISKKPVELLIDTHGQPFGYFIARLSGTKVISYVHYPLISTDMISKVREMRPSYNNSSLITSRASISSLKIVYYYFLLKWYQTAGFWCNLALCNSSWTYNHIHSLWSCKTKVIYPSCDVSKFVKIPLEAPKQAFAISIGQFRPEKDHSLQILSFSLLIAQHPHLSSCKLMLVGSCRDQEDLDRVENLKKLAIELQIQQNVEFYVNIGYDQLIKLLEISQIGLHTMWNEHFGICVVELMASGVVTIAHNSAGPKQDIITHAHDGFLASTSQEYSDLMAQVFENFQAYWNLRENAREKIKKFSENVFITNMQSELSSYLNV